MAKNDIQYLKKKSIDSADLVKYPSLRTLIENKNPDISRNIIDNNFITRIKEEGAHIFGAHKVGLNLKNICEKNNINILGFFDNDESKNKTKLNDILVTLPNEFNTRNKLIIVASGRYSNQIIEQLSQYKCNHLNIHQFQYLFGLEHQAESNFQNFRESLYKNPEKILSAFCRLNDEKSRQTFEGLIKLRLTLETSHIDKFKCDFNDEYIDEEFINIQDLRAYIDVGAYDGDTLDRIESTIGFCNKAYLFEPELMPHIRSSIKYQNRENIFIFNLGISNKLFKENYNDEHTFDLKKSDINKIKSPTIQFIRLDSIGFDDVSFIKIDVEGGELDALMGSSELIKKFKPKLAICAYHRANDYWEIINYIISINSKYKVGMRHYSDILDDTTLYFY